MSPRIIVYYVVCFVLSICLGIFTGFGNSHTPPAPFIIELFVLPIGIILFVIDFMRHKPIKAHVLGLIANGLIMAYVLLLAFK